MYIETYIIALTFVVFLILLFIITLQDKQTKKSKEYYNVKKELESIQQKYYKLMRSYLIARKKDEYEAIEEIERAITIDYEKLGSKNISNTDYISAAMADFYTTKIKNIENELMWSGQRNRSYKISDVRIEAKQIIARAKKCQYAYEFVINCLLEEYPEIDRKEISEKYGI